jgi:hypothetical protein
MALLTITGAKVSEVKKNVHTSLVFSPPQIAYLRSESDRLSISVAELIRRLVDEARPGFDAPERKVRTRLVSLRG